MLLRVANYGGKLMDTEGFFFADFSGVISGVRVKSFPVKENLFPVFKQRRESVGRAFSAFDAS